ncbi:hypothetical protein [Noviherbaspirillum sp.]|uniref:hypothetical protein n=1 Tax=Noviherbaspirillum sp. TaxID=1926288 RepID=UPI002FDFAA08
MLWIPGTLIPGHGVASGSGDDRRYPGGTISLQQPFFLQHGIDFSPYFPGTLNVDLAPCKPVPHEPLFDGVIRWFEEIEERFVISPARLRVNGCEHAGLWYYPHPETKPAHHQPDSVVELLMPRIAGLAPGVAVEVQLAISR